MIFTIHITFYFFTTSSKRIYPFLGYFIQLYLYHYLEMFGAQSLELGFDKNKKVSASNFNLEPGSLVKSRIYYSYLLSFHKLCINVQVDGTTFDRSSSLRSPHIITWFEMGKQNIHAYKVDCLRLSYKVIFIDLIQLFFPFVLHPQIVIQMIGNSFNS